MDALPLTRTHHQRLREACVGRVGAVWCALGCDVPHDAGRRSDALTTRSRPTNSPSQVGVIEAHLVRDASGWRIAERRARFELGFDATPRGRDVTRTEPPATHALLGSLVVGAVIGAPATARVARPIIGAPATARVARPIVGAPATARVARPIVGAPAPARVARPIVGASAPARVARPIVGASAPARVARPIVGASATPV